MNMSDVEKTRGSHGGQYCLAADIGMPDLGLETHLRGLEGVVIRDDDVHVELSTSVGAVRRTGESALEVEEVRLADGLGEDARVVLVRLDVGQLLDDPPFPGSRHGDVCMGCMGWMYA